MAQIQPVKYVNGMSTNKISAILQDKSGFLWLGTDDGLGRFDGYGLESIFNSDLSSDEINSLYNDSKGNILIGTRFGAYSYSQSDNTLNPISPIDMKTYVNSFAEDKQGNLWVATNLGVYIFNSAHKLVRRLSLSKGLSGNKISDIQPVAGNEFLIATENGLDDIVIDNFNASTSISEVPLRIKTLIKGGNVHNIFIDKYQYVWVCINEIVLRKSAKELLSDKPFTKMIDNTEAICVAGIGNEVWFGSRGQGIVRFSLEESGVHPNQIETWWIDKMNKSEIKNTIISIFQDKLSNVWIGSLDGFYVVPTPKKPEFLSIKNSPTNANTPSHNTISSILTDKDDNVWMATANGIDKFRWINKSANTYQITRFLDNETPTNLIRDNKIQNIIEIEPNVLLLSTKSTLRFFNIKTKRFYSDATLEKQLNKYGLRYVNSSCKDKFSNVWLGFTEGGIGVIKAKTNQLYKIQSSELDESRHRSIICDKSGAIWFSSDELGLFCLTTTGDNFSVKSLRNYPNQLFGNVFITAIQEYKNGNILIGTSKGIFMLNTKQNTVKPLQNESLKQGFYVKGFLEDKQGNIWVSTIKGIYKIRNEKAEYYEPIPNAFIAKAQYIFGETISHDGSVFLGGVSGLIVFDPQNIHPDTFDVKPCISRFSILGKPLFVDDKHISKDINQTQEITLTYRDFQFSIEFSSVQLLDAQSTKYAYRLLGFDSTWVYTDVQRRLTSYSNLTPGNYQFQLKATNSSGIWMNNIRTLNIKVLPAPWKTWWAYSLYLIFLIIAVTIISRSIFAYKLMKQKEEMTQWKIRYYHNILNTIKTPLSLLHAPLTNIISNFDELPADKIKESLYVIQTNAKRLSHFVRQLVEFRKIDIGKASLKLVELDIIQFSKLVYETFKALADEKGLNFTFNTNVTTQLVIVDAEKIEMVLFNLLSNAIKFTNQGGTIQFNCTVDANDNKIWISISDSGIGIAKENHERIFERFWSEDLTSSNSQLRGTGIGLSLVKDFLELHESKISVQSNPGQGSEFKFFISIGESYLQKLRAVQPVEKSEVFPLYTTQHIGIEKHAYVLSKKKNNTHLPLIYCVDSDENLLQYLKSELGDMFQIEVFSTIPDVKKAIQVKHPDLIVSEIMFVNVTIGYNFCQELKNDSFTNHIMVIMLSGLSSEDDKMQAYENGADAFVSKPFDVSFLKVRIQSLLKMRSKVKERLKQELIVNPKEVEISADTDLFLSNTINLIEEHLANENFGVDELAESLNITRSMLYRRFQTLVNQSPAEYIKQFRLKRAALLLESTTYNVTEVAEKVGFSDARYFSKLFKEQFGVLPKSYSLSKKLKQ
ncbi:MAG: two-component regulator propeller domain-containing protein [Paludibacter sp.]|nr:two-component regulator propeller domain-containing protein [Paludibacter sp.]